MTSTVTITSGPTITSGMYTIGSNTLVNGLQLGTAGTVINNGTITAAYDSGALYNQAGSKEINTTVLDFGNDYIDIGATSEDSTIYGGGNVFVSGLDENPVLEDGNITVTGGTLIDAYEGLHFTDEVVLNSGSIDGTTMTGGGEQLEHGGTATNGLFSNRSADIVYAGGTDLHMTLTTFGLGYIDGGSSSFATVLAGSDLYLWSGTQYDATIGAEAFNIITSGSAIGTYITAQGNQEIEGGTVTGDVIETGGTVTQFTDNGGTLGATNLDGGTLILESGTQDGTIDINSGTLVIDMSGTDALSVKIGVDSGEIEFSNLTIAGTETLTTDNKGDVTIGSYKINSGEVGQKILVTKSSSGDAVATAITEGTEIPCFCPGTMIRTPKGDVAVENLRPGDEVITADRGPQPIQWIGDSEYAAPFLKENKRPVRIEANAIADGIPAKPLLVSPDHCLLVSGALVPAKSLINGATIKQIDMDRVRLIHLGMERHEIIFANDCPAETFRQAEGFGFQKIDTLPGVDPQQDAPTEACGPYVLGGEELVAIQEELFKRAGVERPRIQDGALQGLVERVEDGEGGKLLIGWACVERQAPTDLLILDIYCDGEWLGSTPANYPRPDVLKEGFGTGTSGFKWQIPAGIDVSKLEIYHKYGYPLPFPNASTYADASADLLSRPVPRIFTPGKPGKLAAA